ncbi:GIY-YIG nuclease family protein [uncultured Draconibacterium sp.]|uniref:GIY-YIG nuclease family protein n=1 Tax=uncultured Draconibacterium sp. TaxID=1573823 RepID=UPI0037489DFF
MTHYVYILFSEKLNRYYTGESADPTNRLRQHNTGYFKSSSTKVTDDWNIFLTIECKSRAQALKLEKFIKKMRNRNFYERLKNEPKIIADLLKRFDV